MPGSTTESAAERRNRWEGFFASQENPWGYDSLYERVKYQQTLESLPPGPIPKALELACAEGHFTARLAARVDRLIAADISPTALSRARARCAGLGNVTFDTLDFVDDDLPQNLDLLVCSEALYYCPREQLASVRARFTAALNHGGHLLMAHSATIADERDRTGFDWGDVFGAKTIAEVFCANRELALVRELRTPLYRIQLFRRVASGAARPRLPEIIEASHADTLPPVVESAVIWGGAVCTRAEAQRERSAEVPILMYHSIADDGPLELSQFRTTPPAFREQLRFLRRHGYHSVSLGEWASCVASGTPLSGRPVIITFDDGYRDFATHAAPLLEAAGLRATLFVVSGRIGGTADWDTVSPPLALMGWDDLRDLQERGFEIGSHTPAHIDLRTLSDEEIVRDSVEARATFRQHLGRDVVSIAFPWGWSDARVRAALARGGYRIGLRSTGDRSTLGDDPMELPRIEVCGGDDIDTFARRLQRRNNGAGSADRPVLEPTGDQSAPPQAEEVQEQLRLALLRLEAIETSTIWRASAPLRSWLSARPRLARLARRSARVLQRSLELPRHPRIGDSAARRRTQAVPTPEPAGVRPSQPPAVPCDPVPPSADAPGLGTNGARPTIYMDVASCLVANIPVLIPSHNNASHVRRMLAQLRARGLHNLVVVDNGSSTAEMQDFLRSVATTAKVVRLTENRGPQDIFLSDATYRWLPDLFCVTDPDLEFNPNLPDDFLPELAELTERFMVGKAGFSLDIENRAEMRDEDFEIDGKSYKIWEWEEQFWQNRIGTTGSNDPVYRADIDTTFALYNKRYFDRENHLDAVRVAGNYTCRHLPWYRNHGLTDLEAATYRETQKFSYYMRAFG